MTAAMHVPTSGGTAVPDEPRRVYLYPGQIFVASEPFVVTTILGSCVAVCLWDPTARVAGINHYLLPDISVPGQSDLRYANTAVQHLIDEMLAAGARQHRMVAKLVGGASILMPAGGARLSIGEQNVLAGRKVLGHHAIEISAEQTGGTRGRKLLFHTGTGRTESREIGR